MRYILNRCQPTSGQLFGWLGVLALALTACGTTIAEPEPEAPIVLPTAISTAVPVELPTNLPPTATLPPTSTPVTAQSEETDSGNSWVIQAKGVQCEGDKYESLDEAVKRAQGQGLNVIAAEEIELMVTTVCGASTSTHYRLQIPTTDVPTAEQDGWRLDNNQ
jgi:hypothetical protein